jgi:predicted nuclease of predicted toxin-antitoxin system
VRILLDKNMPRKLLAALTEEGHEVDSVKSLQLQGIDNGALYQLAVSNYDLCFTRDAEFSRQIRMSRPAARLKLVHVIIPQTRQDEFVRQFLLAFRETDWSNHKSGDDWPTTGSLITDN